MARGFCERLLDFGLSVFDLKGEFTTFRFGRACKTEKRTFEFKQSGCWVLRDAGLTSCTRGYKDTGFLNILDRNNNMY